MFDWADAKYLVAVSRHGSTVAAAKALGVNQSTVQRRLIELERRLGLPLVHKSPTGYRLTEAGLALLPRAEALGEAAAAVERQVTELKSAPAGIVRLTCPEPVVARLIEAGLLQRLAERHPELQIEFVTSDKYVDLAKGEADVALRSGDPGDETLVGRKEADSIWAVYASRDYVQRHGRPAGLDDLVQHPIIGFNGSMANHRVSKWLAAAFPGIRIVARNESVLGVLHAARSGIGLAALPTTLGDADGELVQVLPPVPELARSWYLLARPDARDLPRVSALIAFLQGELPALRRALMG